MTSLKLIKKARDVDTSKSTQFKFIRENITYIAKQQKISSKQLFESVTHVLAGLGQTAQYMHPNSVASFLAGVAKLSDELVSMEDVNKKHQTLKLLATAAMKFDDLTKQTLPNESVVKIAQYGARFPDVVQKYIKITSGVNSSEQINDVARQLLGPIEQAMNTVRQASKTIASNPSANANVNSPVN